MYRFNRNIKNYLLKKMLINCNTKIQKVLLKTK